MLPLLPHDPFLLLFCWGGGVVTLASPFKFSRRAGFWSGDIVGHTLFLLFFSSRVMRFVVLEFLSRGASSHRIHRVSVFGFANVFTLAPPRINTLPPPSSQSPLSIYCSLASTQAKLAGLLRKTVTIHQATFLCSLAELCEQLCV